MSNHTGEGFDKVIGMIDDFQSTMWGTGALLTKRERQAKHWMHTQLQRGVLAALRTSPAVRAAAGPLEAAVGEGKVSSRVAARQLLSLFLPSDPAA